MSKIYYIIISLIFLNFPLAKVFAEENISDELEQLIEEEIGTSEHLFPLGEEDLEEDPLQPLPKTLNSKTAHEPISNDNADSYYVNNVILQGLNKITARSSKLKIPLGSTIRFGNLEITLRLCWHSLMTDKKESKALLEIWEHRPGDQKEQLFYGWMLASSPAISSLEHPVYDIRVIECL